MWPQKYQKHDNFSMQFCLWKLESFENLQHISWESVPCTFMDGNLRIKINNQPFGSSLLLFSLAYEFGYFTLFTFLRMQTSKLMDIEAALNCTSQESYAERNHHGKRPIDKIILLIILIVWKKHSVWIVH